MIRLILALGMAALTAPAFAMTADSMSCADFTAMESADQMAAMTSRGRWARGRWARAMAAGDMMDTSPDAMAMEAVEACEGHPDMTVGEAMKAGN